MIIAAAQTKPVAQDTEANIRDHLRLIESASHHKVQLLIFPEMSLTGYERELAATLSFSENDPRLTVFREKASLHRMHVVVGAPIRIGVQLHIGAFVLSPDGSVAMYTKQFLHSGEETFFSPGFDHNPALAIENEKMSVAICADITNPLHPKNAAEKGTTIYAAGIFYTPTGIAEAHNDLSAYAQKYSMNVLMANYSGPSYGFQGAGQSAFWNDQGEIVAKLSNDEDGLLVVEYNHGAWKRK